MQKKIVSRSVDAVSTKAHSLSFISKVGYIDFDIPSILSLSSLDGCRLNSNEWKSDQQHTPSRQSVDRYFALYCDKRAKKLLHGKVQKKTMTRFTGEHSLRSAASFAGVEASIGLIVGEDE